MRVVVAVMVGVLLDTITAHHVGGLPRYQSWEPAYFGWVAAIVVVVFWYPIRRWFS